MRSAFTIIELLVVVTIIVVLLALLAPALDKAIYQAELAVCATNLNSIGSGAQAYAVGSNRHYPNRIYPWLAERIASIDGDDLRVITEGYIHWKLLVDPMSPGPLDLSREAAPAANSPMSSYTMRFGYQYTNHKGMMRLGDRLDWTDGGKLQRFTVIASDQDRLGRNEHALSSHNDAKKQMAVSMSQSGAAGMVISRWWLGGTHMRDELELNFAFTDGSVTKYQQVKVNDSLNSDTWDDRFGRVPQRNDNLSGGADWNNLPLR